MPADFPTRVILVAENASDRMGGEAAIPCYYFRGLRERGVDTQLVVHERSRADVERLFDSDRDRIHYIPDSPLQKGVYGFARHLPHRIKEDLFGVLINLITEQAQRKVIRSLVIPGAVVHQPTPVAPRFPSRLYDLGAPVVIGPMNGNMDFPDAFRNMEATWIHGVINASRSISQLIHRVIPGKRKAAILIAANDRTRKALPATKGKVEILVENGAELQTWKQNTYNTERRHFLFMGRLVDWKRLDILLNAIALTPGAHLDIAGEGVMRPEWEALARQLGITDRVHFHGWCSQPQCAHLMGRSIALVLPSVYECGGAVVLEAMAAGLPAIATRWGGPIDYIDQTCGTLIDATTPKQMAQDFASAMQRLLSDPQHAKELGKGALARVEQNFSWERKIEQMLGIYGKALGA